MRTFLRLAMTMVCLAGLLSGCADSLRREQLQRVANDWCETIRASQVMPVYPLTEDLQPGDVFLVRATLSEETHLWKKRGYLPLDFQMTRLQGIAYDDMYFDGYFGADPFSGFPNERPNRGAGPVADGVVIGLSTAEAPRAAFPSYTFEVETSRGLQLAIPIKGVPVGLSYLGADRAAGSITIADARTYAAEGMQSYSLLKEWADDHRNRMAALVEESSGRPLILRVVTRVYLTGGVVISLTKSGADGGEVRGGNAPDVPMINADGTVNENHDALLEALGKRADPVTELAQAGGAVKFTSATSRSVTLQESFDRLLVIGYLGYDVPVFKGGLLGAPIPTFQRLENGIEAPPVRSGVLTEPESKYKVAELALESLTISKPGAAMQAMSDALSRTSGTEFDESRVLVAAAVSKGTELTPDEAKAALTAFKDASIDYISVGGGTSARGQRLANEIIRAINKQP